MPIDRARATEDLRGFAFQRLLIEELGWDHPASRHDETVTIDGATFTLAPVAEKRGVRIFHCAEVPDRPIRQRIEREVAKLVREHLIIFADAGKTRQIWQWVAREKGKPASFREHLWLVGQSPNPLLQKLDHIAFSLNEEEGLTLFGTTVRMRDAFDRERITKRFYEAFKQQHDQFLGFITGLATAADKAWYASLMLNRLMFVYFIQKKGFLDGDIHYLRSRLASVRAEQGRDQFHSFYRAFLLKLFHGGLATPKDSRDAETARLIGNIPYLNGGLFEPHALEGEGNAIQIGDAAFESVFAFFDQYEWTLDTRAIERADGREINPDVLGHIFEKYINQKQMGAYYTKEDVTDYITRSTVIPWLFRNAEQHDRVAFEPGGAVWRMLSDNPDAYIFKSIQHGADQPLPGNIAVGIGEVAKRDDWNKVADGKHGLPTETWREVVARRERYESIKAKAAAGEISSIEDFITFNLDIRQFAVDAIQFAESPDLVRAFWKGISVVKVLDPACGSGAFLFAALNILYDLYDACLERMEQFVAAGPEGSGPRQLYSDFREVLARTAHHPSRPYFIYKSIILDNLYGVDLMDEAVEICKLRLFLKLAAQLEGAEQIEPLPDIDFNIRAGNTLIGYTSFDDVRRATAAKGFDFDDRAGEIEAEAQDLGAAFDLFRQQQTELNGAISADHKLELRARLAATNAKLDLYLAQDYGVEGGDDLADTARFKAWNASHKPFHWLAEFYGIISGGGFDVVVGNPPYVKASEARREYTVQNYATDRCSDIYAWVMERAATLLSERGAYGMIVPLSLTFSGNFQPLRDFILEKFPANWFSSFARIPAALFSADVRVRNTIHIGLRSGQSGHHTTITHRWFEAARPHLVECIEYARFDPRKWNGLIPKLSSQSLLNKIESAKEKFPNLARRLSSIPTAYPLHFKKSAYNWVSFSYEEAPSYDASGARVPQTKVGQVYCENESDRSQMHTLLNGKFSFIWWCIVGDDFDVTKKDFEFLPCPTVIEDCAISLQELSVELHAAMQKSVVYKLNAGKRVGNFNLARCRDITDRADEIWSRALTLEDRSDEIELCYAKIVKTNFDDDEGEQD
jgi:hypothetical protein